jgi:4-hydroxy-tetrahydrodipicolinate synthase
MKFETPLPDGVFAAGLTPLNKDLSIDHGALIAHCEWLLSYGCDGVLLLGTTGEANSFSLEERIELIDRVADGGIPVGKLMIGTGCCAYPDTIRLTRHAVERGIAGVLMLPPFYYKQVTDKGLEDYFDLVINSVRDERLKIYLYHFPRMSAVPFSVSLARRLAEGYPGIVVGMKDSSGDLAHTEEILREIPGFKVYTGTEELLLPTLRAGGAGCISATVNATAAAASELFRKWKTGDADDLQERLSELRRAFSGYPLTSALKQMFYEWTGDPDWLNVRPPNSLVGADAIRVLSARLQSLGFSVGAVSSSHGAE